MPVTTRKNARGRVAKPAAIPHATRGGHRGRATPRRTGSAPRGARGRSTGPLPHSKPHSLQAKAIENAILAAAHPDPREAPGTPKVTRVYMELYESKPQALNFVYHAGLTTSPDVETMTLNLMDFCLLEENWNPALSHNKLAASCFYFASKIVEQVGKAVTADEVARAFEHEVEVSASAWMMCQGHTSGSSGQVDDITIKGEHELKQRALAACRVEKEDVERGYAVLWGMRELLSDAVGQYSGELESMSEPQFSEESEAVEHDGQSDGDELHQGLPLLDRGQVSEETPAGSQSLAVEEPEMVELDDFETSIEEFAS